MERINVEIKGGQTETVQIYNIADFPYDMVRDKSTLLIKRGKDKVLYHSVFGTFDIETTALAHCGYHTQCDAYDGDHIKECALKDKCIKYQEPYAYMYQWQVCIYGAVIFGRTFDELIDFFNKISEVFNCDAQTRFVFYVHNLAYEFQFIRDYIEIETLFAKDERKPMKVLLTNGIEFRCSYFLSNMSLKKFCENSNRCVHYKQSGDDYNYRKIRNSSTPLTELEKSYCYCDVKGLEECILSLLEQGDTITSIPLTNTGYVRRTFRKAMKANKKNRELFLRSSLIPPTYDLCKKAFRGGNTHASRFFAGKIIPEVNSYDITSSYPFQMMVRKYPMERYTQTNITSITQIDALIAEDYSIIMQIEFFDIDTTEPIPYIDLGHCRKIRNFVNDNGRILSAEYLYMCITEIDLEIIRNTYSITEYHIVNAYIAKKDYLPKEFREEMLVWYDAKTQLKGVPDMEYEYLKSKNRLNSSFGMMVSDIIHDTILFDTDIGEWTTEKTEVTEDGLESFYKSRNNFLPYQWGIYVTAYARLQLQQMLDIVGKDVIYTDTDSIKYIGNHTKDFDKMNKELLKLSSLTDVRTYSVNKDNEKFYLGLWDNETPIAPYKQFKTLGAKKYCMYVYDKKKQCYTFNITVSGMGKKSGAEQICNTLAFNVGNTYFNIGRTVSYYNDNYSRKHTEKDYLGNKETFLVKSNVAILDTTYTLGITDDYSRLLTQYLDSFIDK